MSNDNIISFMDKLLSNKQSKEISDVNNIVLESLKQSLMYIVMSEEYDIDDPEFIRDFTIIGLTLKSTLLRNKGIKNNLQDIMDSIIIPGD